MGTSPILIGEKGLLGEDGRSPEVGAIALPSEVRVLRTRSRYRRNPAVVVNKRTEIAPSMPTTFSFRPVVYKTLAVVLLNSAKNRQRGALFSQAKKSHSKAHPKQHTQVYSKSASHPSENGLKKTREHNSSLI